MKHYRILIVEDDLHNHDLYRAAFEKEGFAVTLLPNADGFFAETVHELHPDIISMDLMIGKDGGAAERDGLEAIEVLKQDLRTHSIPVFVLSNFFEDSKVHRAKELGVVDYINLASHAIAKIPAFYRRYLDDPQRYKPSHPLLRTDHT